MGDDDQRAAPFQTFQQAAQGLVSLRIQGRIGFVEQQHARAVNQRPCHGDPLFDPARQRVRGAFAHHGVETARHSRNGAMEADPFRRLQSCRRPVLTKHCDVVQDRPSEQPAVLRQIGDLAPDARGVERRQVVAVNADLSRRRDQ